MAGEGGRTWRTWQLVVVAAVALIVGLIAGAGTKTKDTTVSAGSSTSAVVASTSAPVTRAPVTAAPSTAPPATAAKVWTVVTTLTGTANKAGDNFHLAGGSVQQRLSYKSAATFFAPYLLKAGDSLDKSGGFPEVTCSNPCDDSTRLNKASGDYYLDVKSATGTWTVTVEELR